LNKAVRTEIFEKFKTSDMIKSAKIEFTNFEKLYGEIDIPKIALMLSGDKTKGWADILKQRGTINFTKETKTNEDAKIKWQAIYTGDKYEIIVTVSQEGKFMINFVNKANKNGYAIDILEGGKKWDHGLWKGAVKDGEWKTKLESNQQLEDCV